MVGPRTWTIAGTCTAKRAILSGATVAVLRSSNTCAVGAEVDASQAVARAAMAWLAIATNRARHETDCITAHLGDVSTAVSLAYMQG